MPLIGVIHLKKVPALASTLPPRDHTPRAPTLNSSKLYLAAYDIYGGYDAFILLAEKLEKLYGSGERTTKTLSNNGIFEWVLWKGEADTACLLICERRYNENGYIKSDKLMLIYGKTDAQNMIDELRDVMRLERFNEMKDKIDQSADDYDGL